MQALIAPALPYAILRLRERADTGSATELPLRLRAGGDELRCKLDQQNRIPSPSDLISGSTRPRGDDFFEMDKVRKTATRIAPRGACASVKHNGVFWPDEEKQMNPYDRVSGRQILQPIDKCEPMQ